VVHLARNNPRVKFTVSISSSLKNKLDVISDVTGTTNSKLVDESLVLLSQKYKDRVLNSGRKGVSAFMAKTIAICSNKGGVGKTTSTAAFADLLGRRDYRVLVIDADPQGNLSKRFGYDPKTARGDIQLSSALMNILSEDQKPTQDFVLPTQNSHVNIIPNDDRFSAVQKELMDAMQLGINTYKILLEDLSPDYDYILIDCRPSVDYDIAHIMQAVQYLLIPVNAADDSVDGVNTTINYAKLCRRSNPDLKIAGVFFEAVNMRTAVAHDYVPQIRNAFKNLMLETIVPHSEDAKKAESAHQPVSQTYPSGKATRAYSKLLDEVIARVG